MKKWMTLMLGMALLFGSMAVTLRLRRQHRREPMFNRAPGQPGGIDPEFAAFSSAPVPAVDPEDMRRVWPLFELVWRGKQGTGATGIDTRLLAEHCSAGANIAAISARVALTKALQQQGLLDAWREGDSLRPKVFEVTAKCPLTPGAGTMKFDPEAILAAIELAG